MENWGLPLFDEQRIFYNASTSSSFDRVHLVSVICHELAHQWLGNLATCETWNQLTMNEGMATVHEYDCMQSIAPELNADALAWKVLPPAGDKLSAHDGPLTQGLEIASDPLVDAVVPESDLVLENDWNNRNVYVKGGGFFFLLRLALDAPLQALQPDLWRTVVSDAVAQHSYGSWTAGDLFESVYTILGGDYLTEVGPGKKYETYPWAALVLSRTQPLVEAMDDPTLERAVGSNGTSNSESIS